MKDVSWWIEITKVKGRVDRESGDYALGKALWSPQRNMGGADSYRNMREIKKGDIVLHLVDNKNIVGISVVDQEYDDTFTCPPGTEWEGRPGYLIRLRDRKPLFPPIEKGEILNDKNGDKLISILNKYGNLFYNTKLKLRQGAYITRAPKELVELINEIYRAKTGRNLPYFEASEMEPTSPEVLHLLYKIAWRPDGYKGDFCGDPDWEACEAFTYIRNKKLEQPCSEGVFHCIDEHKAFANSGWRVTIHPHSQTKELHRLVDGESLVFLVAPTDKYKSRSRLVGFYTIKGKVIQDGKVKGLEAEKGRSSKFDPRNEWLELDDDKFKEFFNIRRWSNPRVSYEFIPKETAIKVLEYVYEMHKNGEINDPDVNLDAIKNAIEILQGIKPLKTTIYDYLLSRGFHFEEPIVSAFYTALKTKGFVILAGLTGTGKTKLPQLFCDLVAEEGQKLFLPVRPEWRDSKPLVGYFNPIDGTYETTELLKLIETAYIEWDDGQTKNPFFVLLDEMNLARVEYYFADFLSVLESGRDEDRFLTREPILLHALDKGCKTRDGDAVPSEIRLPPNLYFIGTVNLDETTYSFSPKVLDRAFVIEFWNVDLEKYPDKIRREITEEERQRLKSAILEDLARGGRFLFYTKEDVESAIDSLGSLFKDLKKLHGILQEYGLHFGYRVVDEIALFYRNALESMEKGIIRYDSEEQILDYAVLMKVLPKIHGNRSKLEAPLARILAWAINPEGSNEIIDEIQDEDGRMKSEYLRKLLKSPRDFLGEGLLNKLGSREVKYRHTAEKVTRMMYQLYSTGFASYL